MAYAPLSASISDVETDAPVRQRTVVIWLILAYVGLGVVMAPFSFWNIGRMYTSAPVALYVVSTISLALNLAGAIALFRLQATAIRFFAIALAIGTVYGIYFATVLNMSDLVVPVGMDTATFRLSFRVGQIGGLVLSLVVYAAMFFYLLRLRRRGILR